MVPPQHLRILADFLPGSTDMASFGRLYPHFVGMMSKMMT